MAAWHFKVRVLPSLGLEAMYGTVPKSLPNDRYGADSEVMEVGKVAAQLLSLAWEHIDCSAGIEECFARLLPESKSWSSDARFFGDGTGNKVEIWRNPKSGLIDDLCIFYSLSKVDPAFIVSSLDAARSYRCVLLSVQNGSIFMPEISAFVVAARASSAARYLEGDLLERMISP
jgi:hypothetical protein